MVGNSASLALLLSFACIVADAIRPLKDGPMIDAEGREYKSATVRADAEEISRPQLKDRFSVRVQCTGKTMIIVVKDDMYKNGHLMSPGELSLGEVGHSQRSQCRAVAAGDSEYIIEAELQDCGSKLTVSSHFIIATVMDLYIHLWLFERFECAFQWISRYLRTTWPTQTSW